MADVFVGDRKPGRLKYYVAGAMLAVAASLLLAPLFPWLWSLQLYEYWVSVPAGAFADMVSFAAVALIMLWTDRLSAAEAGVLTASSLVRSGAVSLAGLLVNSPIFPDALHAWAGLVFNAVSLAALWLIAFSLGAFSVRRGVLAPLILSMLVPLLTIARVLFGPDLSWTGPIEEQASLLENTIRSQSFVVVFDILNSLILLTFFEPLSKYRDRG